MPKIYDALLVLCGGLEKDGSPHEWVRRRLAKVVDIYQGEEIIILGAGTTHKPPPLDTHGFPIIESMAGAKYLIKKGLDPDKILVETSSYDTIGSIYFSKMIHVDPCKFKKLLVITSKFHMARAKEYFRWIYNLTPLSGFQLDFLAVSDEDLDETLIASRSKREKESLDYMVPIMAKIKTLEQFHKWFYTKHGAYALSITPKLEKGKSLDTY